MDECEVAGRQNFNVADIRIIIMLLPTLHIRVIRYVAQPSNCRIATEDGANRTARSWIEFIGWIKEGKQNMVNVKSFPLLTLYLQLTQLTVLEREHNVSDTAFWRSQAYEEE